MSDLRVCVYCASSKKCDPAYLDAAERLGRHLAQHQATLVYGGGGAGAMARLAQGVLQAGGKVIGVIPRFMMDLEWGHSELTSMHIVENMRERKHHMLEGADAVVALPGGCGTLEELFETITLKRLGLYLGPIILVNTRGFYDRVVETLDHCIAENFMDTRHRDMWTAVNEPEEVLSAIHNAPPWSAENLNFAVQ
ncbi:MAG TPA: TIGR00730 family Rossman fold protein [Terriglobia bacterium]|nr:TIGR00730 family Rossman fold protein [Terriglobia bacterium]